MANGKDYLWFCIIFLISSNKSHKHRKVSLKLLFTANKKILILLYRELKIDISFLPFAINVMLNLSVYGKRQTAKMKLLPSVFSFLYSKIKIFVFAVNCKRHFYIFV